MRLSIGAAAVAFVSVAVFSQSTQNQSQAARTFDVADIHASANVPNPNLKGPYLHTGRYELRQATMVDLIKTAYSVDPDKVQGGPNWLEWNRYDVIAKGPAGLTAEAAKAMLQQLLADRFKLAVHRDNKSLPAYVLTAGKGKPKLKEADPSGDTGCKMNVENFPAAGAAEQNGGQTAVGPMLAFTCRNMTMAAFADGMRTMGVAQQYIGNNPVLDKTGLEGAWDFTYKYSIPLRVAPGIAAPTATTSLQDAVDKQLGLKLELQTISLPVVVVDSVNPKATDNPPDVAKRLPELPTEFDVADLKPINPDNKGMMAIQIQPGGRVNLTGLPVKLLIQEAWSVNNDTIVGAPKWMETDRYDIIAKAPGVSAPAQGVPADFDPVWVMLRALLLDRFNMKVHFEDRPATAYNLVASKPKLKKADPASRTKWTTVNPDAKAASGPPTRTVVVQNMTMAQFAEKLQGIAPDYIHSPVVDATGFDGAYDFTFSFSPSGLILNGGGGRGGDGGAAGAPSASEPNGGVSLLEAMEKQLGLKLQEQRRPVQVLVIDRAEQKPAEN